MRVLHVTESLGGVMSSVLAMAEATPGIDHHLAVWPLRSHFSTGDDWRSEIASLTRLPRNPVSASVALRRRVRELFPDVVHTHSSYAGLLVRGTGLSGPRVAYSPHCFGFERRDAGGLMTALVTATERRLVRHTDLVVAVSPHEVELATRLGHQSVAYVPNRPLVAAQPMAAHRTRPWHVVTVGRVTAQKDWRYFLHVKRYAEEVLGIEAVWEWLGAGDPDGEDALVEAGVRVSGWLPRADLLRRLGDAQVYLHTAAWEGAPISVLEAAAVGLPLVVRAIGPTTSTRAPGTRGSVAEIAERIAALHAEGAWAFARNESLAWAREHTGAVQGDLLQAAYVGLAEGPVPDLVPQEWPEVAS
ncbi:glycosyltransferase [Nocardioides sp. zg-536]|uniref:Glycosyltransferase n=1 Tax=Nocardioides faecalis TaxID=2803858 RepID=A0A938Y7Y9_9ACTN|nr:glycosyltransferase [Nocardioides faecalis]MBM9459510.1 glycosyltransferase [Nocardioides faecalis]QVI58048.1 glycosyltransferase [Nocardioides faecalis]